MSSIISRYQEQQVLQTVLDKPQAQFMAMYGRRRIGNWRYLPTKGQSDEHGAQVDLLLDRNDDAITICEIKYGTTPYKLEKSAALNLINKVEKFKQITKTKKQIFVALVTTLGVKTSLWLEDTVHQVITLEDLFD